MSTPESQAAAMCAARAIRPAVLPLQLAASLVRTTSTRGNVGDALGPYLYRKLTGKQPDVCFVREPGTGPCLVLVGSILCDTSKRWPRIVWGAGAIRGGNCKSLQRDHIYGVRGPRSAEIVQNSTGRRPLITSDPGLFLARVFPRKLSPDKDLGFVLHSVDRKFLAAKGQALPPDVIDNYSGDVELFAHELQRYSRIASSSLHGCVLAHAYGIPALPLRISGQLTGGSWKFHDYYGSLAAELNMPLAQNTKALLALKSATGFWTPDVDRVQDLAEIWLAGFNSLMSKK